MSAQEHVQDDIKDDLDFIEKSFEELEIKNQRLIKLVDEMESHNAGEIESLMHSIVSRAFKSKRIGDFVDEAGETQRRPASSRRCRAPEPASEKREEVREQPRGAEEPANKDQENEDADAAVNGSEDVEYLQDLIKKYLDVIKHYKDLVSKSSSIEINEL